MSTRETPRDSNDDRQERSGHLSVLQSLCQRLNRGDSQAMQQLFDRYSEQLVRLAGKNIHPALLKRFDGEDVVQSVFRTFFRRQEEGKIQIEHSQQLWQLLATITLCKTRSHARRHTAEKRNAKAEEGIAADLQLFEREPSPEDALAMWEEIDAALDGLPERAGKILSNRLEGKNKSEIAKEMNLSRQTIHRILRLVEERLTERFELLSTDISKSSKKNREPM
jgi:RNA polymerase sigma factor (sigma-70 family)